MTTAAIYCRISRDQLDQRLGVKRQEKDCRSLAQRNRWKVGPVIVDNDTSATNGKPRPGYERLLSAIEENEVDAVIVWDLDRLVRRPVELEHFFSVADAAGMAKLATIGDNVDPVTGEGVMVARIKGAVAAEEVRKSGKRLRRKHLELAESGRPHGGGNRPFGYGPDFVTVVESEAALLRQAAERYLAGEGLLSIARSWNDAGIVTTGGKQWRAETLRNCLRTPRVAGLRVHRGEVAGPAVWPAIIDRETWEQVTGKMRSRGGRPGPSPWKHLLTGLLVCWKCGCRLHSASREGKAMYGCRIHPGEPNCGGVTIVAEPVEEIVVADALYRLNSPVLADALEGRARRRPDDGVGEIVAAEAKLEELAQDWAADRITRSEWMTARKAVEKRLGAARTRLRQTSRHTVLDGVVGQGDSIDRLWKTLAFDRKRAVLATLIDRVVIHAARPGAKRVDPDRVEVVWAV